jgi:hypothetical protein
MSGDDGRVNSPMPDIAAMASRNEGQALPATAPSMAAPSSTGSGVTGKAMVRPVVSAMIWRTSALRLAPPLITIISQEMPRGPHDVDHVRQPIGEAAQAGDEQPLEGLDAVVEIEPGDHRARIRIGIGRAIAEEFRQHMGVAGEPRRLRRMGDARHRALLQEIEQAEPGGLGRCLCFRAGGVRAHQMVDAGAGGGLAALVQPEPRHHGGEIRPPDSGQEGRLGGGRHDAGRGAHDVGKAVLQIAVLAAGNSPANGADAAGMGVDQRGADRRAGLEAELARRLPR